MLGADVPTAHTADAAVFIGLAGIAFVDCSNGTTGGTNSAIIATAIGFGLEREPRE